MKLFDIIRESLDAPIGSQTSSSPKEESLLAIAVENINDAENALNNIDNYGKYTQNFVLDFESNREKILGPRNFNKKMEGAIKQWDNFNKNEKRKKLESIISLIGNEKWGEVISLLSDKGDEASIKDWISNNSFNDVKNATISPKGSTSILFGSKASIYFPSNITKDQLNNLLSSPMVKDINYTIDGNQIIFIPFKDPKGKPVTKAFLEKIIKTIMDNAQVKYNPLKVEPKDTETTPGVTKAGPSEASVSFKVTLDPAKIKGKRTEINGIIQRLKNTYDKNFEYSNNVIVISKVKNQQAKLDLIKLFAPYALKATPTVNEEFLRMQKLAGIITEEEYNVKLNEVNKGLFDFIKSNSEEIAQAIGATNLKNISYDSMGDISANPLFMDYEMVSSTSSPNATIELNGETFTIQDVISNPSMFLNKKVVFQRNDSFYPEKRTIGIIEDDAIGFKEKPSSMGSDISFSENPITDGEISGDIEIGGKTIYYTMYNV